MAPKQVQSIRLSRKLLAQIRQAAAEDRRTLSSWVQLVLEQEIARRNQESDTHG